MANPDEVAAPVSDRRPVVLRGGTVLTMDDAHTVLAGADVLVADDRPVTTHAGVWGATNDDGIRLMHEHGFMTPETVRTNFRYEWPPE